MKVFHFLLLLLLAIQVVQSQKGRARRRVGSKRRAANDGDIFLPGDRDRRRSGFYNTPTLGGMGQKTKRGNKQDQNIAEAGTGFIKTNTILKDYWKHGLFIIDLIWTKRNKDSNRQEQKKIIQAKLLQNTKGLMTGCSFKKQQRTKLRQWFLSKKWQIIFSSKAQPQQIYRTSVNIINFQQRGQLYYKMLIRGKDEIGSCELQGFLIHRNEKLSFYFYKLYDDRQKAEQVDQYKWLVFSGTLFQKKVKGNWYFQNFRNLSNYSGQFEMRHY